MKINILLAVIIVVFVYGSGAFAAGTVYFTEDFESDNAPAFRCWFKGEKIQVSSTVTDQRAFSGTRSAYIQGNGISYFEIPLPKPLKWDRQSRDGIGRRPLYLSARVWVEDAGRLHTDTVLGFNASIVPKRRPGSQDTPLSDSGTSDSAVVTGRTHQWLWLVLDVSELLNKTEDRGQLNPDQIVLQSISMTCYGGGKFYIDDIRLATTPPEGWTPSPPVKPLVDAASYFRRDPKLEAMIFHGAYGGTGSAIRDLQLHPATMRDMKRHYLNFVGPSGDIRSDAPERYLKEYDLVFDQARQYDMPFIPKTYIGSRYASFVQTDEQLRAGMLKIIRRFKNKSHLLAWYLEEEPGADRATQYLKEKRWVDEEDPNHNSLMIFNSLSGMEVIGPAQSVVIRDIYPIGGLNTNPWQVPMQVRQHAKAYQQPFILTTQIFGGEGHWTPPTVGQFRLMAYGALAEGAKGFCHFLYSTPPLFTRKTAKPLYGSMTDVYGTPSPIYDEIKRHLGPDLFSIGELLRTCRPDDVPAGVKMLCRKVEDTFERQLPAIAVTRLVDKQNRYEILGLYNNNPDQPSSGILRLSSDWLDGRVVLDLSAHSLDIARNEPILLDGRKARINLSEGDGKFIAILSNDQVGSAIQRMQATRFEAVRKMVEFDLRWLEAIDRDNLKWTNRLADARANYDAGQFGEAVARLLALDKAIQQSIDDDASLSQVITQIDQIRTSLSRSYDTINTWAKFEVGKTFPPEIEPAKSYCTAQTQIGKLFVGFSDLMYTTSPEELAESVARLSVLAAENEIIVKKASVKGVPQIPCSISSEDLKALEDDLVRLGWERPPSIAELFKMTK